MYSRTVMINPMLLKLLVMPILMTVCPILAVSYSIQDNAGSAVNTICCVRPSLSRPPILIATKARLLMRQHASCSPIPARLELPGGGANHPGHVDRLSQYCRAPPEGCRPYAER
jgi:hypothetical protein